MRSYILLTAAWVMIFICGCVVGVMLPIDTTPVGKGVGHMERVVEPAIPIVKAN